MVTFCREFHQILLVLLLLGSQDFVLAQGAPSTACLCRAAGKITPVPGSEIGFEICMPAENWNGKFVGTGNGGFFGAIADPLTKGYAVSNTATKVGWATPPSHSGNPEKVIDFGWRAVHEMTVQSKAVLAEYDGVGARASYWTGCSVWGTANRTSRVASSAPSRCRVG